MRKIILLMIAFVSFLSVFVQTNADISIFTDNSDIIYCKNNECSLDKWTEIVKNDINDIEKNRSASVYAQDLVKYLLTFITIIAVLYVIYAWFKILTSAWNDDNIKKSKTTITSVLIWIVIIWLAYSIVTWILKVITTSTII